MPFYPERSAKHDGDLRRALSIVDKNFEYQSTIQNDLDSRLSKIEAYYNVDISQRAFRGDVFDHYDEMRERALMMGG